MSQPVLTDMAYDLEATEAMKQEADALLGGIVLKLMTDETMFNENTFPMMQNIMSIWAGKNPIKRLIAKSALWPMPKMIQSMGSNTGPGSIAKDLAKFIQLKVRIKTEQNKADPTGGADKIAAAFRDFVAHSDMGALKEMIDSSAEGMLATTEKIDGVVQEYLGKFAVFAAIMPSVLNISAGNMKILLDSQIDMLPPVPDLVYELLEGVWGAVDGRKIGEVLNLQFEMQKRLATGNHLAGDGVRPALQILTAKILREVAPAIDPESFAGMKVGKAENKEAIKNGVSDYLKEAPELGKAFFTHQVDVANASIRGKRNRLQALLDIENFDDIVEEGAEKFDALELADFITALLEVINVAHETNPDLIPEIFNKILSSIDPGEMETFGEDVFQDAIKAIKPAVAPLMPSLINGFCDLVTPEPGEESSEMTDALARFKTVLGGA